MLQLVDDTSAISDIGGKMEHTPYAHKYELDGAFPDTTSVLSYLSNGDVSILVDELTFSFARRTGDPIVHVAL